MENHLIIGLGGTGGKILREMRKRIYEDYGENEPQNVKIDYLYVDSSPSDLDNRSDWKTLGGSVHLLEAQKVSIHGIGSSVLDNLALYPGIQAFINPEDRKQLNDIKSLITDGIGGQRRRLGRLLFASNLSGPEDKNFTTRLSNHVEKMTNATSENEMIFHVCAGLAGGTGSGSIIDTIAQIRKKYSPQYGGGKLYLYLYVPEMIVATPSHNAGYYQANGYAALTELNAMSVKSYNPYDVTGEKDEFGNVKRLLKECDAFDSAYLFSNVNEVGRKLEIGHELPSAVADFLFQKIVVANLSGGRMNRLYNCENNGTEAEKDAAGEPVRSRSFLTFGVKRIEYPESEVKEYVAYNFAKQAARQFQFNLWRDGIGFDECTTAEVGMGYKAEIKEEKTKENLMLSDAYLMLSKPIVENPGTAKWKDIAAGWETITQFFAEDAQTSKEKKSWIATFTDACELQYNTNYRGEGVKNFYKTQRSEKGAYAAYIRRHIEEILFNDWRSGVRSILEIEKYIALLIADCEERLLKYKEKISNLETYIEQETAPEIKRCNKEWDNIGWLKDAITGASAKVFSAYKTAKCEHYTLSTKIEGYKYAAELLQLVKNEMERLQNSVGEFHKALSGLLKRVEEQAESKCKPLSDGEVSASKIVKKYDPSQIRETTKQFTVDEEIQKKNASEIRMAMVDMLGEDGKKSFNALLDRLDLSAMEDIFLHICVKNSETAMESFATSDPTRKMLDVNILEKIKQEYNSKERLEEFIRGIVRSAQCYLQFNSEEIAKVLPGSESTSMMKMVQLSLPDYNDPSNFRQSFIKMFAQVCPGFKEEEDLSKNNNPNQIVVVAAASGFPLRYVANVAVLREKYNEMLVGPKAPLNKMVLHTESFKRSLPDQFESNKTKDLIPVMLLAFAMELPIDKTNPTTGETFKAIGIEEEGIISEWVNLGKNIFDAVDALALGSPHIHKVIKLVDEKTAKEYAHNTKKAELKSRISALLQGDLLALCGNNDLDLKYQTYKKAALELFKTELAEL